MKKKVNINNYKRTEKLLGIFVSILFIIVIIMIFFKSLFDNLIVKIVIVIFIIIFIIILRKLFWRTIKNWIKLIFN